MVLSAGTAALVALAIWLRLLPSRRGVIGVDAWYHLAHAEALRRDRRLPARLPQYLLADAEQAYPPLFPLLLAAFPAAWLQRRAAWIAPAVDALQLLLLLVVARRLGLPTESALLAGFVYATTPDLTHEYGTLSSRSLASLLFSLFVIALYLAHRDASLAAAAVAVGAALLLTHKMAAQLAAVMIVSTAVMWRSWNPIVVAATAVVAAIVLTGGFYLRVARAHRDVLRYWRRHAKDRGAHPVYDSPLYAAPDGWRTTRLYAQRRAAWRMWRTIIGLNPWLLLAIVGFPAVSASDGRLRILWIAATYGLAFATLFIPPLRLLGEGFRYLKFAAFAVALIVGETFATRTRLGAVALGFILVVFAIRRLLDARQFELRNADFGDLVDRLRASPAERIAVLPTHRADPLAFLAKKHVLWGGQSSGYERLGEIVPVLRRRFDDILDANRIDLVILDQTYVDKDVIALASYRVAEEVGRYVILARSDAPFAAASSS